MLSTSDAFAEGVAVLAPVWQILPVCNAGGGIADDDFRAGYSGVGRIGDDALQLRPIVLPYGEGAKHHA